MTGDVDAEVPAFNNIFTGLAKLWPELPEKLEVSKSTRCCGCLSISTPFLYSAEFLAMMLTRPRRRHNQRRTQLGPHESAHLPA